MKIRHRATDFPAFQGEVEAHFEREMQRALTSKYPHILPRFPEAVQQQIIHNMLARAKRWGLAWKSSLSYFVELMLTIAPNFDEQPRIRAVLAASGPDIDAVVLTLPKRLASDAWAVAEAGGHDLPLFVPADLQSASLVEQTQAAFRSALWDLPPNIGHEELAKAVVASAKPFGIDRVADGPLTLAACQFLLRSQFQQREAHPWISEVLDIKRDPRTTVAMLKLRLALEVGRFV